MFGDFPFNWIKSTKTFSTKKAIRILIFVTLLFCLGDSVLGQTFKKIVKHSAAQYHSFALDSNGILYGWGINTSGQLADGSNAHRLTPGVTDPTGVMSGKTIVSMVSNYGHNLFLDSEGTVYSSGMNQYGQLGDGTTTANKILKSIASFGAINGKRIVFVSCGYLHSLAIDSNGVLYTWGYNYGGQLGDGTTTNRETPVQVTTSGVLNGKILVSAAGGYLHSLALSSDGKVFSFGQNGYGQLGDGTQTQRTTPVAVDTSGVLSGKTIVSIASGYHHSFAIDSSGILYSWGENALGQLGDGTTSNRLSPVGVDTSGALNGKTIVSVTSLCSHTLALDSNKNMYSWGHNGYGQLGIGTVTSSQNTPVLVNGPGSTLEGKSIISVRSANYVSQALDTNGTLYTWGNNLYGQLGDGGINTQTTPTKVRFCFPGFSGESCPGSTYCYGTISTSSRVCNGKGICSGTDVCVCSNGFSGDACENIICHGISSNMTTSVCSGHGYCAGLDQCICNTGYGGNQCDKYICNNKLSNDSSVCSGHGACTSTGCVCNSGFSGYDCNNPTCFGIQSGNPGVCSSHGFCVGLDQCSCNTGYGGNQCDKYICNNKLSNDTAVCSGHGTCNTNGCTCSSGFSGSNCEGFTCFGFSNNDAYVCNSHGSCTNLDTCNCFDGFSGSQCQQKKCSGKSETDPMVCSSNGKCINPNTCSCNKGYSGANCEIKENDPFSAVSNAAVVAIPSGAVVAVVLSPIICCLLLGCCSLVIIVLISGILAVLSCCFGFGCFGFGSIGIIFQNIISILCCCCCCGGSVGSSIFITGPTFVGKLLKKSAKKSNNAVFPSIKPPVINDDIFGNSAITQRNIEIENMELIPKTETKIEQLQGQDNLVFDSNIEINKNLDDDDKELKEINFSHQQTALIQPHYVLLKQNSNLSRENEKENSRTNLITPSFEESKETPFTPFSESSNTIERAASDVRIEENSFPNEEKEERIGFTWKALPDPFAKDE